MRKVCFFYYWTLNTEKCLMKLELSLINKIEKHKNILENRETKRFYVCKPCGIEVTEEKALDHGFSCEECADVYELSDNSGPIRDTKARITRTEKNLTMIKDELELIRNKAEKRKIRAAKKADKEEIERKEMMKEVRATARKKVAAAKREAEEKLGIAPKAKKKAVTKKTETKKAPVKKAVDKKKAVAKKKAEKKKPAKKKGKK